MPTPIAPIEPSAKSKSAHSTRVVDSSANASPLRTPSESRPFAYASTRSAASGHEIGCHSSPRCSR